MNCFSQLENGIFATEKDIQELKNKASAHILVYSDSHGKAPVVRDIFEKFGQKDRFRAKLLENSVIL